MYIFDIQADIQDAFEYFNIQADIQDALYISIYKLMYMYKERVCIRCFVCILSLFVWQRETYKTIYKAICMSQNRKDYEMRFYCCMFRALYVCFRLYNIHTMRNSRTVEIW